MRPRFRQQGKTVSRTPTPYIDDKKTDAGYFTLILSSDFKDMEKSIKGLVEYKEIDEITGRERIVMRRVDNHYLSEEGALNLIQELHPYLNSDIKLGVLTRDEFLMTMDIIRKFLHSYITNNLYSLGMDTEAKQRKAPTLFTQMMAKIRAVFSRSVAGMENQRSHGDIKLSGELDFQREDRFRVDDIKN